MYIILLNKLRLGQISCSGRSGTRWQYGVPKWYKIIKGWEPLLYTAVHHSTLINRLKPWCGSMPWA